MKLLLLAVVTVVLAATNTFCELETSSDGTRALHFIGTVEGKSFFFDDENFVNWFAAGNFCASAGMHLASLETEAQYNLIKNYNDELFVEKFYYWTSGRDAQDLNQFKWNDTGSSTGDSSTYMSISGSNGFNFRSCVHFDKFVDRLVVHISSCQDDNNYPLCET